MKWGDITYKVALEWLDEEEAMMRSDLVTSVMLKRVGVAS